MRPEKQWYLTELAAFLETRPSSLQREIDSLSKAGILEQWRDGRRVYFKADIKSPIFRDLKSLFEKTAGITSVLQQELKSLTVAFNWHSYTAPWRGHRKYPRAILT